MPGGEGRRVPKLLFGAGVMVEWRARNFERNLNGPRLKARIAGPKTKKKTICD